MTTYATRLLRATDVHALGFRGAGEIVGVCDTGLDIGELSDIHPCFANRVIRAINYGRRQWDDPDGHGTHVCGCVVGGGTPADSSESIAPAPLAQLIVQSVFKTKQNPFGFLPLSMTEVLEDAFKAGARIHSMSFVQARSTNAYAQFAQEIDAFVHEHPDFCVITAVGNEGWFTHRGLPDGGTLRSPSMAKNAIAVGGSHSNRGGIHSRPYRDFFPRKMHRSIGDAILNLKWADDSNRVAPFSGRGPTADGRVKPDVVAPATAILAARSRRANVRSVWGKVPDRDFVLLGGTSTAAPLVAGCVALVREYSRRRLGILRPTAAFLKALVIGGTTRIDGLPEGAPPDMHQGWGRVDSLVSLCPAAAWGIAEAAVVGTDEPPLAEGEERVFRMSVLRESAPFRATLVWTDPPGPRLFSDLDLVVHLPNRLFYHGNRRIGDADFDRTNNVEQVRVESCPAGDLRLVVSAVHADEPQPFALVVHGAFGTELLRRD